MIVPLSRRGSSKSGPRVTGGSCGQPNPEIDPAFRRSTTLIALVGSMPVRSAFPAPAGLRYPGVASRRLRAVSHCQVEMSEERTAPGTSTIAVPDAAWSETFASGSRHRHWTVLFCADDRAVSRHARSIASTTAGWHLMHHERLGRPESACANVRKTFGEKTRAGRHRPRHHAAHVPGGDRRFGLRQVGVAKMHPRPDRTGRRLIEIDGRDILNLPRQERELPARGSACCSRTARCSTACRSGKTWLSACWPSHKVSRAEARARAADSCRRSGWRQASGLSPAELSGGMQKRVGSGPRHRRPAGYHVFR